MKISLQDILYFIRKNKSFPIFLYSFLCRFIWTFVLFSYTNKIFLPVAICNLSMCISDFFLVIVYKKIKRIISFTYFILELTFFALFEAYFTKIVCGMEFCLYACIPGIFLFLTEEKPPKYYFIIMTFILVLSIGFITYIKLSLLPPHFLFLPEQRNFLIACEFFYTITTLAFLLYGCLTADYALRYLEHKKNLFKKKIDYNSKHDPLTGLMNRRRISEVFNTCNNTKITENINYAVCIFDIDNFKLINDTYGHDAGDFILKQYTKKVWDAFPEPIKIGRWGGEEFLIIFPAINEKILYDLEDLRYSIASTPIEYNDIKITVTATYGISSSRTIDSPEKILADADEKLLEGKTSGKNRIIVSENF